MRAHNDIIAAVNAGNLAASFSAADIAQIEAYAANIVATFHRAGAAELDAGAAWYGEARAFAVRIAHDYGLSVAAAAGVIAVTSPSASWAAQLKYTGPLIEAIQRGDESLPGPFYGANKAKARRIVEGEPALDVVSGEKVSAFFWNIYDTESDLVTVDRHALRVALAEDLSPDECKPLLSKASKTRQLVLAAYHLAAEQLGLRACVVQAITWVVYRGSAL